MVISRGIVASRVKSPKRIKRPKRISTAPTKGAITWGAGIPIFANRPTPSAAGIETSEFLRTEKPSRQGCGPARLQLDIDPFGWLCLAASCLLRLQPCKFIGCGVDFVCWSSILPNRYERDVNLRNPISDVDTTPWPNSDARRKIIRSCTPRWFGCTFCTMRRKGNCLAWESLKNSGRHGYRLSPGTLYPILHGMEKNSLLRSRSTHGEDGRSRACIRRLPTDAAC